MLCSNFLGGTWKTVPVDKMCLTRMKGGMSNMLFLCKLPDGFRPIGNEPDKTLLRVYFNPETESHLVAESVIFTLLSERQLGPQLYGIFNGGRLEEYIVSRPLRCSEIRVPDMSRKIAGKLAHVHKLSVPISKEPTYLCEALERWMQMLLRKNSQISIPVQLDGGKKMRAVSFDDIKEELHVVRRALKKSPSPIVFCHNDLQEGNILLPMDVTAGTKELVFIDFEYSSYNYRAFDFANHFCEWTIDYTLEQAPYFTVSPENFPTEQEQATFIGAYLAESGQSDVSVDAVKKVIEETAAFVPVSHFLWGVWALLQVELSPVKFGFAEYGRTRLGLYFQMRSNLLKLLKKDGERGTNGDANFVIENCDSTGNEVNGQAPVAINQNGRVENLIL